MPRGNKAKIMEYSFPIPKDLAEQDRIVSILDKFDTLTSSISEGLPREIALRAVNAGSSVIFVAVFT
jgi:type I restriction enzyme S subunit